MNALVDSNPDVEISFLDSLLNLAQWLDSQDTNYRAYEARVLGINLCTPFVTRKEWEQFMHLEHGGTYYLPEITNKERVLAVLMLREMILSGDI
jgi:hypothetical protein